MAGNVSDLNEHRKRVKLSWPKLAKALTDTQWDLRVNDLAVALVMLTYVDGETLECYPSIDEISRRARVSRHTAIRATRKLQELGLVKISKTPRAGGKYARNVYDFSPLRLHVYQVPT